MMTPQHKNPNKEETMFKLLRFGQPAVVAALLGTLTLVPSAFGGQPVTQTLTPLSRSFGNGRTPKARLPSFCTS